MDEKDAAALTNHDGSLAQLSEAFPDRTADVLRAALVSSGGDVSSAAQMLLNSAEDTLSPGIGHLHDTPACKRRRKVRLGDDAPFIGKEEGDVLRDKSAGGNGTGGAAASSSNTSSSASSSAAGSGPPLPVARDESKAKASKEVRTASSGVIDLTMDEEDEGVATRKPAVPRGGGAAASPSSTPPEATTSEGSAVAFRSSRGFSSSFSSSSDTTASDAAIARELDTLWREEDRALMSSSGRNAGGGSSSSTSSGCLALGLEDPEDGKLALRLQEREERKELARRAAHPDHVAAEFLELNAVLFRAMLNETEQRELLRDCFGKLSAQASPGFSGLGAKPPPQQLLEYNTGWLLDAGALEGLPKTPPGQEMPCCVELAKNHYAKFRAQYGEQVKQNNALWCAVGAVKKLGEAKGNDPPVAPAGGILSPAVRASYMAAGSAWWHDAAAACWRFCADDSLTQAEHPIMHCPNPSPTALQLPDTLETKTLWARMYGPETALGFHQDPPPCGWVLIINLGAAARFAFYHPHCVQRLVRCSLESGDALLFNGEVLYHGVEKIGGEDTLPDWWREVAAELGAERGMDLSTCTRIGLQMRVQTTSAM